MNRFLVASLFFLVSAVPALALSVDEYSKSVGVVEINNLGGHGSGTFIDPVHILTAGHVVDDLKGKPGKVRLMDGTEFTTTDDIKKTDQFDLAILTVDATKPYSGPIPQIKCGEVPPLTPLVNIGNPLMAEFVHETVYATGGRLSPMALKKIFEAAPKPGPSDALKPGKDGKPKKNAKNTKKKKSDPDDGRVTDAEQAKVFSNIMIVQGSINQGQSGSTLFNPDGHIVGILNMTFTNGSGSITGLGAAVKMEDATCEWIKSQVGEGVFVK